MNTGGRVFLALYTCLRTIVVPEGGVPHDLCWGVVSSGMHAVREQGLRPVVNLSVSRPLPVELGRGGLETAAGFSLGKAQTAHRHGLA